MHLAHNRKTKPFLTANLANIEYIPLVFKSLHTEIHINLLAVPSSPPAESVSVSVCVSVFSKHTLLILFSSRMLTKTEKKNLCGEVTGCTRDEIHSRLGRWLSHPAALAENMGPIPSTHMVANNHL